VTAPDKKTHAWRFYRAGGVDQVDLSSAADLEALADLDQKLWVALSCPTQGLAIDERSLALVDTDQDGRIRPPEILAAVSWAREVFRDLGDLFESNDELPLASIDERTETGRNMLSGAKRILSNLGKPFAKTIALDDVKDTEKIFVETKLNGDGIVPADSADDEKVRKAIEDIMVVMGSVRDRSGKPGVDAHMVEAFFTRAGAWAAWAAMADADPAIRPLGDATAAAAQTVDAVASKIDDYFVRCRLAAFDDRVLAQIALSEATATGQLAMRDLGLDDEALGKLPVALPAPGRLLPLGEGVNPAWVARMNAFASTAATGLLGPGRTSLTEDDWTALRVKLEPWKRWQGLRPADPEIEKLDPARIRELASGDARAVILDLVARDAALAAESNQIDSVEKAVRLRRDLVPLLRNYVNFSQFYGTRLAAFQVGVLYLDGRSCDLCLPVENVGKHAALATLAHAYLVYCDCTRRKDAEKRTIVAAVTAGEVDNLMAGRNGVFYDRHGDDWEATITRVVENPISVRQAFWAPYKRLIRFVEERLAKHAAEAEEEENKKLQETAVAATEEKKKEAPKPAAAAGGDDDGGTKLDIGTVAAIGVAVGGIATFLSSMVASVLGLGMWMPLGLFVLLLAISGPSMLIAWLKLRQRNIGPLLDANGWAVNAFARINVPFGAALTSVAALPPGATRSLVDPFAEKKRPWKTYALLVLLALGGGTWFFGKADPYLPVKARAATVLHRAPVASATAAAPAPSASYTTPSK
jgi:hypothetical protein